MHFCRKIKDKAIRLHTNLSETDEATFTTNCSKSPENTEYELIMDKNVDASKYEIYNKYKKFDV